jgi:hypothetical protein
MFGGEAVPATLACEPPNGTKPTGAAGGGKDTGGAAAEGPAKRGAATAVVARADGGICCAATVGATAVWALAVADCVAVPRACRLAVRFCCMLVRYLSIKSYRPYLALITRGPIRSLGEFAQRSPLPIRATPAQPVAAGKLMMVCRDVCRLPVIF